MGREKLQGSGAAPSSACSGGSRLEGKGTLQAEVAALPTSLPQRCPSHPAQPHNCFPPPAGDPRTAGTQTVVAVFRTRNSPVFELLPWCVADGFGAS